MSGPLASLTAFVGACVVALVTGVAAIAWAERELQRREEWPHEH